MKQSELNSKAESYLEKYKEIMALSSIFEPKGVFHSELLMSYTLAMELGIEKIIESGRARGQSTEVLARICEAHGIEFHSIEFDKISPDVAVAEKRLAPFKEICTLHYGDGFEVMPSLLDNKKTLIIIDGPKGIWAQKLGMLMLKNKNVKAVMFHDTHRDALDARPGLERYFSNNLLVSDDHEYVQKFQNLDDVCWEVTSGSYPGYAPYRRPNQIMRSYAGTFSCVQNDLADPNMIDAYLAELEQKISIKSSIGYKVATKLKLISLISRLQAKLV